MPGYSQNLTDLRTQIRTTLLNIKANGGASFSGAAGDVSWTPATGFTADNVADALVELIAYVDASATNGATKTAMDSAIAALEGDFAAADAVVQADVDAKLPSADFTGANILALLQAVEGGLVGLDAEMVGGMTLAQIQSLISDVETLVADEETARAAADTALQTSISNISAASVGAVPLTGANQPNGYAALDASGIVDPAVLPAFVDAIVEVNGLPVTGETGKIYLDLTDNSTHRWSGTQWVAINSALSLADEATKLATARAITLQGDATGTVLFNGTADVAIDVEVIPNAHQHNFQEIAGLQAELDAKADAVDGGAVASRFNGLRNVSLNGANSDVQGSANWDGSGDLELSVTVLNDSHSHSISTVTGLQAALDEKLSVAFIADDLLTNSATKALSANQGVVLDDRLSTVESRVLTSGNGSAIRTGNSTIQSLGVLASRVVTLESATSGLGLGDIDGLNAALYGKLNTSDAAADSAKLGGVLAENYITTTDVLDFGVI